MVGIGVFCRVTRWWMMGCFAITLGDVALCEVDGALDVFGTLGAAWVSTLGGELVLGSSTFVAALNISVNWFSEAVYFGCRLMGALFICFIASIKS